MTTWVHIYAQPWLSLLGGGVGRNGCDVQYVFVCFSDLVVLVLQTWFLVQILYRYVKMNKVHKDTSTEKSCNLRYTK